MREQLYLPHEKQLFEKMKSMIHPNLKIALEKNGVLDEVWYALADDEIFWKWLIPMAPMPAIIRIYDYWTDMYTHVRSKGKDYRYDTRV